ncbi:MAG: hypothetical protein GC185_12845 [Alphaproteobacteria bacterium]|nr:hypothetical protein [Alphaproteobacteria bacterium]
MPHSFEGKTAPEIVQAMSQLVSKEQSQAQFSALASLDAPTRALVVDGLEKNALLLADNFIGMVEDVGLARAKKQFTATKAPDTAAAVKEEQAITEIVRQVATAKGDAADPLIKTFAAEISKLTAEQTATENAVYGALFDAIEKTMGQQLEEQKRLMKIDDAFGWRLSVGVKEHFNNAGKYEQFAQAPTEAEKAEQKAAIKGLLFKSEPEAALAFLTATDVFMRVARRIGTDEELAGLIKADAFDAADVAVLEKNKLTSLAALVKTAIANKPK